MEEKGEISMVSHTTTQDTEMSEPVTNQKDFFVWIKKLDSQMENSEQFLQGSLNPFENVLKSEFCKS